MTLLDLLSPERESVRGPNERLDAARVVHSKFRSASCRLPWDITREVWGLFRSCSMLFMEQPVNSLNEGRWTKKVDLRQIPSPF